MQSRQIAANSQSQNAKISELRGREQPNPNHGYVSIHQSSSLIENRGHQPTNSLGSNQIHNNKIQKLNNTEYPTLSIQVAAVAAGQHLNAESHQFRSPLNAHKKKSIASVGGSTYAPYPGSQTMDGNLERAGTMPAPNNILNLASRSTEKQKRRKHVSPNHRYQNTIIETEEAEMLELLCGPTSPKKRNHLNTFDSDQNQSSAQPTIYDARDLVPVRLGSANDQPVLSTKKQNSKVSAASNPEEVRRKSKLQKTTSRAKSGMKSININLTSKDLPSQGALQSEGSDTPNSNQWAFSVYVRIRPHKNAQKQKQQMVQMKVRGQTSQILQVIEPFDKQQVAYSPARRPDQEGQHSFLYDSVFSDSKNNLDVFQAMLQPLIPQLLEGYNVTCFAYGQTGSGKTHTMLGQFPRNKDAGGNDPARETDEQKFERLKNLGLSNLAIQNLFYQMYEKQGNVQYNVRVSYLEIYNEQVHDLLADLKDYADYQRQIDESKNGQSDGQPISTLRDHIRALQSQEGGGDSRLRLESFLSSDGHKAMKKDSKKTLKIVEDPQRGVIVQDLLEIPVEEASELMDLIMLGNMRRCVAPTGANKFSSRSHAILIFNIEGQERMNGQQRRRTHDEIKMIRSKLQIIDLAGSERASGTQNTGQRLIEGGNINKSLMALGQCINILAEQSKKNSNTGLTNRSRSNNMVTVPNQNQDMAGSYQSTPSSPKANLQKRAHVPYRDSKLTRLLKDSLGGSTKTVMIACISQLTGCYEETMNTLKYASAAKSILNKKKKNEIILQEYSREHREEQMRRLAEIAEQERQERLRREEEIKRQIDQAKIPIASPVVKVKQGDSKRPDIEVPQKLKREIEKISVINLGKLENKLTGAKTASTSGNSSSKQRKQELVGLLQQQLIPNIVYQYNLRHQIQSNQILIDFQSQGGEQSETSSQNKAAVLDQMKGLQASLNEAQDTQNKIQNSILSIFDAIEKQSQITPQPTKPQPPEENPQQTRLIASQSEEISKLKESLAKAEGEIQRMKTAEQTRGRKSIGREKKERQEEESGQKAKDEIRNMEMIINDKNVEIDMLKEQYSAKEKRMDIENQALTKENTKLKKMVDNLEKQAAAQAQKLKTKDILIESLNSRKDKNSMVTVSTGPTNQGQTDSGTNQVKPLSSQLSKFTNREKGQGSKAFQKQKLSMVIENNKQSMAIDQPEPCNYETTDDIYQQSQNAIKSQPIQAAHNSHLSKKQKTLKRYLSGVRVDSIELNNVEQLNALHSDQKHLDKKQQIKIITTEVTTDKQNGWLNGGGQIQEREADLKAKDIQGLTVRTHKDHKTQRLLPKTASQEDLPLSAQDNTRRRDHMYPKLRQSVNNTRFQRNLQPRSQSRVSRGRGAPTYPGSRSRSNFSRYGDQSRIKRSYTNVGFAQDMAGRLTKNNSRLQHYQEGHASQSILIPNASEIYTRQKQPFKPLGENDLIKVQPRYGSQDESFTFQNDITERPSDIINQHLRPSFTRQNPFTVQPGAPRTDPKDQEPKSRHLGQNASMTMHETELPLQSPPAMLNTINPTRGADDSIYNDIEVVQESFQSQKLENPSHRHLKMGDESVAAKNFKQNGFTSAASDMPAKPGAFYNMKVGSGAIPAKSNQPNQLSEGVFLEHVGGNVGPGVLNVSTLSMEFQTINTKRSGHHSKMGQQIGQGLTITSLEDQILDNEYENERLRQLGFFGEPLGQSPQVMNAGQAAAIALKDKGPLQRGLTQQAPANSALANLDLIQHEKASGNGSLPPGPDERLFHLRSVQQLPLQQDLNEQHLRSGHSVPQLNLETEGGAYQSRSSLPIDGASQHLDYYVSRSGEQEIQLSSKIVTPEPKHQQIIFKNNMESNEQQIPSSARAHALGLIAQNNIIQGESRHSHTHSKIDQHNIIKKLYNKRDLSIENQSIKSHFNLQNAAASSQKTNFQKNPFGQRFKEMLNLAEVRKVSKERRNTNQFVKGLVANFGKLKDPHMVSQREMSNQILIVDTNDQAQPQRGPLTDNGCSPIAADISDTEDSLNDPSPGTKNKRLNLQNQNELYRNQQPQHSKHQLQKDHSSQRLQQFVDDNNKKLEEILKMAEKIEMRSVESHGDEEQEQRRSRSLRKHSLNNTDSVRRKKDRLSEIDIDAAYQPPQQQSSHKLGSPRANKITLAGPRSWAERGNLQASGGDTSEKQP